MEYVTKFSALGADVIKFQTRDNMYLFDNESYNKKYITLKIHLVRRMAHINF